jgi:type VI secretion system protein ImpG
MSKELYPFYERELAFIRQMSRDFATRYPSTAGRLLLEANTSSDPHVERMLEGFALIGARIQHRLDDEFPELTDGMLQQLYPHFMAPVPSIAILQFDHDHTRSTSGGAFRLQRGTMLRTQPVGGLSCRFRTCFDVDLVPVRVAEAQCLVPPFPQNIQAPSGTAAVIRLRLESLGNLRLSAIPLESLMLFLNSDSQLAPLLYQALLNDAKAISASPVSGGKSPVSFLPGRLPLDPAGLEPNEALFPYPASSPQGLRLLTEFFACPA